MSLWVEKYRPKTIDEVIFQDDRQVKQFKAFVKAGNIPNLFLYGPPGTGKSSVSASLINDLGIDPADVVRINCSDDKIDAMRSRVTSFSQTSPLGDFKIVRLEEIDYLGHVGQALLRSLIETTSETCRYIATCNYENKVIPPLRERFQSFYFRAPDKEHVAIRVAEILDKEKVEYDLDDLITYIDIGYPSVRNIIQTLQGNSLEGKLLAPKDTALAGDWRLSLLTDIAAGNWVAARKMVCEQAPKEEHEAIYRFLYENLDKLKVKDKDTAILTIAEHLYKHAFVADSEINLAACFISLGKN